MSDIDEESRQQRIAAMTRDDATRALLDALAMPDGRCVAKAWNEACLLFGRFGWTMKRSAFEIYLDDLASGDA